MKNGSEIQPIIRVREATDKNFSDYSDKTDLSNSGSISSITSVNVSGKDSWAAKLYPGSSSHKNGRDNPTVSLGVVLYIPSDNNKGIKGAQIPDNIIDSINSFINLIFDNLSLLGFFVRPTTLKILIPLVVFAFSFKYVYKIVIWVVKKIPFLGVN